MTRRLVLFTPGHTERGGAQRRSMLLARGLAAHGWEVRVVTRAGSIRRPRVARSERLTVVEIPGFGNRRFGAVLFMLAALPLGLVWGARASAFVSLQLMSTSTVAATCALLLRRPFVALATTTGDLSEISYLRRTRTWAVRRWLLSRAAYVLAQTDEAREPLSALLPPERIGVLPNPVEVPAAAPALDGLPRAAFAGRLSAEKNLFVLLDAWRDVARELPEARLTLLGEGGKFRPVEQELRRDVAADPVLRETVSLPGWAPDVATWLAGSDVFVLPSNEEGMSNALLEACALGRIVIASDIPPNRAVLGDDYPFLVPPADASGFRDAMLAAFDPDGGGRNRARVLVRERVARFSNGSVVERLGELLDAASSTRN